MGKQSVKEIIMYGSIFLLIVVWFINFGFYLVTGESSAILKEVMMFLSILGLGMLILLLREMERI